MGCNCKQRAAAIGRAFKAIKSRDENAAQIVKTEARAVITSAIDDVSKFKQRVSAARSALMMRR
jgi:hypothetical protein